MHIDSPVSLLPDQDTMRALYPSPRHPDPLGGGERIPTGMVRESMRSVEELGVMTVKAMAEPEMTAGTKEFLMPERAMAEAKARAETKFLPAEMTQHMTGAKTVASSRPPSRGSGS